jgi:hypothetical protein
MIMMAEGNIAPSSLSSCFAIYNLGYIKVNQAECELLLLWVNYPQPKLTFLKKVTEWIGLENPTLDFWQLTKSAYTKPSLPVL